MSSMLPVNTCRVCMGLCPLNHGVSKCGTLQGKTGTLARQQKAPTGSYPSLWPCKASPANVCCYCCARCCRWCEHDPLIIWGSVQRCIEAAVEKATAAAGTDIKVRNTHPSLGATPLPSQHTYTHASSPTGPLLSGRVDIIVPPYCPTRCCSAQQIQLRLRRLKCCATK